jgi:hypothetical protein
VDKKGTRQMKVEIELTSECESQLILASLQESYYNVKVVDDEDSERMMASLLDVIEFYSTPMQFEEFQNKNS